MRTAVLLASLALCTVAVYAGLANPIPITLNTPMMGMMNATAGNFYTYSVPSTRLSAFYHYAMKVQIASGGYVSGQPVLLKAYWTVTRSGVTSWQELSPASYFQLSTDAVATSGALNVVIDPKTLYEEYTSNSPLPASIPIGFLVANFTSTTNPNVYNSVFTATLTEFAAPMAMDANGDVPTGGNPGRALTGSCPGTYSRCQVVASMQFHDHVYLEAAVTVTGGSLYSATLRNAALFSIDDVEYFNNQPTVYPRTCALTNSSCSILNAYYYVEMRTALTQVQDATYSVTWTTKAAAHAAASASLFTAVAAAAVAFLMSRN